MRAVSIEQFRADWRRVREPTTFSERMAKRSLEALASQIPELTAVIDEEKRCQRRVPSSDTACPAREGSPMMREQPDAEQTRSYETEAPDLYLSGQIDAASVAVRDWIDEQGVSLSGATPSMLAQVAVEAAHEHARAQSGDSTSWLAREICAGIDALAAAAEVRSNPPDCTS
jgi:hypothetical protein